MAATLTARGISADGMVADYSAGDQILSVDVNMGNPYPEDGEPITTTIVDAALSGAGYQSRAGSIKNMSSGISSDGLYVGAYIRADGKFKVFDIADGAEASGDLSSVVFPGITIVFNET